MKNDKLYSVRGANLIPGDVFLNGKEPVKIVLVKPFMDINYSSFYYQTVFLTNKGTIDKSEVIGSAFYKVLWKPT